MNKEKNEAGVNHSRRNALKIIASTTIAVPVLGCAEGGRAPVAKGRVQNPAAATDTRSLTDPDLLNPNIHWNFVLSTEELLLLNVLANIIIPRDTVSPSAGDLNAQNYINEWVSAPYDNNRSDLIMVRGGLVWIRRESLKRYNRNFVDLSGAQAHRICDDIRWLEVAKPEFQAAARFFAKVRDLCATAFYTTEEGMADIGYVGNKPSATFDGPPLQVLRRLGLEKYA